MVERQRQLIFGHGNRAAIAGVHSRFYPFLTVPDSQPALAQEDKKKEEKTPLKTITEKTKGWKAYEGFFRFFWPLWCKNQP